ncbi:Tryptophan synthase alpha chain [Labilithrix luteola]|uniref:Tryptophan synthase alpha chain n=1 Tax=Labilithrix luteola TaxID=1391654 RepID=A0A0K1Q2U4_9BACT|nr:hypothetical protein [Labilithrix luteola]AKV00053.1 Tryptophan synthase alpha chain [Labilithrix luteola]
MVVRPTKPPRGSRVQANSAKIAIANLAACAAFGALVILLSSASSGCSSQPNLVGETLNDDAGPSFSGQEGGSDAGEIATEYCPTSKCAEPFTTCPTSTFSCDIDLSRDPNNCGACGQACPVVGDSFGAKFTCNHGKCVMTCNAQLNADCDGIPDNGCEVQLDTPMNCGGCGIRCADGEPCKGGKCGCPPPLKNCGGSCVDTTSDDYNCGKCGETCTLSGGPPEAYYGCVNSQCDQIKCQARKLDCDHDLKLPDSNGCEISTDHPDDANCGGCGIACPAGVHCTFQTAEMAYSCGCPPGMQDCTGTCVDVASELENCGACGRQCAPLNLPFTGQMCNGGECDFFCQDGHADCNDSADDGCETSLLSDPRNCGGCGISCDLAVGQACVGGHCAVEACGGIK